MNAVQLLEEVRRIPGYGNPDCEIRRIYDFPFASFRTYSTKYFNTKYNDFRVNIL
jgi:hypothetical protein